MDSKVDSRCCLLGKIPALVYCPFRGQNAWFWMDPIDGIEWQQDELSPLKAVK
jgi:hypothetical protein